MSHVESSNCPASLLSWRRRHRCVCGFDRVWRRNVFAHDFLAMGQAKPFLVATAFSWMAVTGQIISCAWIMCRPIHAMVSCAQQACTGDSSARHVFEPDDELDRHSTWNHVSPLLPGCSGAPPLRPDSAAHRLLGRRHHRRTVRQRLLARTPLRSFLLFFCRSRPSTPYIQREIYIGQPVRSYGRMSCRTVRTRSQSIAAPLWRASEVRTSDLLCQHRIKLAKPRLRRCQRREADVARIWPVAGP